MDLRSIPVGTKVQFLYHLEVVNAKYIKMPANIRDMAVSTQP